MCKAVVVEYSKGIVQCHYAITIAVCMFAIDGAITGQSRCPIVSMVCLPRNGRCSPGRPMITEIKSYLQCVQIVYGQIIIHIARPHRVETSDGYVNRVSRRNAAT